ncbi:MAG: hypothetical protein L0215_18340 [Gemmataceae bacterium]|nr:hypothetical protein [Gemmataceae bacterium]
MKKPNRYVRIIEKIFLDRFQTGMREVAFEREDIERVAKKLSLKLPKNLGDLIYTFRYRGNLPKTVEEKAPPGESWIIRPAGRGRYCFALSKQPIIKPNEALVETKIPNATPGIIEMYALSDEQALLAKLRYNRLIDVFSGITCYSLQNHLRTQVAELGQVETDEIYVGLDHKGAHYVFPVQVKGGNDQLNVVQIEQDVAMCRKKFPSLVCRPIGGQFIASDLIALFEFVSTEQGIAVAQEKHYRLVPPDQLTAEELEAYARAGG